MAKTNLEEHLNEKEVLKLMNESRGKEQYQRWQAIYIIMSENMQTVKVAKLLGLSEQTIYKWVYLYNNFGKEALVLKGRGGRRSSYMSVEEEKAFLDEQIKKAQQGLIVIAKSIKEETEKKLGRAVSKDYPYDLLHRHGWRKVVPRPAHPKKNKERQEEFKKNYRIWLPPHLQPSIQEIQDQ